MKTIREELKNGLVKITYISQTRIVMEINNRRFLVTTDTDDWSYDDVTSFLEFEELDVANSQEQNETTPPCRNHRKDIISNIP